VGSQNVYIVVANQQTVIALCDIKSMLISLGFSLLYAKWTGHLIPYMHTEQFSFEPGRLTCLLCC
jgi:hypothetical protein